MGQLFSNFFENIPSFKNDSYKKQYLEYKKLLEEENKKREQKQRLKQLIKDREEEIKIERNIQKNIKKSKRVQKKDYQLSECEKENCGVCKYCYECKKYGIERTEDCRIDCYDCIHCMRSNCYHQASYYMGDRSLARYI